MYRIESIEIDNFWYRLHAECSFYQDVNIIIGRNGTGKTTFMNILHSVLSVDIDSLFEGEFEEVTIKLNDGNKTRTIKAKKSLIESDDFGFIEYQISRKNILLEF